MKGMSRGILILLLLAILPGGTLLASQGKPDPIGVTQTLFLPTMAWTPDGDLRAAWVAESSDDWEIVASRWDGKGWDAAEAVSSNPDRWDTSPSLAIAPDGTTWLAWSSATLGDDTLLISQRTEHGWSVPQEVPAQKTIPNLQPALATAPGGGLWLAWVGFDGNDDEIYAAHWDGATWSEPQRVSSDDADPDAYDTQPRIAVGPEGQVWLAWVSYEALLDDEIMAARWDGQRWTEEERASADDALVDSFPSLAVARDGTAWLAWHGPTPEYPDGGSRIHVAHHSEVAGWSPELVISSPLASEVSEDRPSLALDSQGRPHITWQLDDGDLGVGYAAFDRLRWSSPLWIVQDAADYSVCAVNEEEPLVLWQPAKVPDALPTVQEVSADQTPLPLFGPPARPLAPTQVIENRHMAFGDSITWGDYPDPTTGQPVGPYPARLEALLDNNVVESEVLNMGVPGEKTVVGEQRLGEILPIYRPQFVEIMEGTNDIKGGSPPNDILLRLIRMDRHCLKYDSRSVFSTVIPPRTADYNMTLKLNIRIAQMAVDRQIPLADNWQAFHDYGPWEQLYIDHLHPNSIGMQILASTFFQAMIDAGLLPSDKQPPTAQMLPLPSQSECMAVAVAWTGDDSGGSGIASYDVQVQDNGGPWSDWLLETSSTSATYSGAPYGHTLGFRVRARDQMGNLSAYSAPATTQIIDNTPPESASVAPLPPYQIAPFTPSWSGYDRCGQVAKYDVEYRVGSGSWVRWLTQTSSTSAAFEPASPQCGQTYSFRVRAFDLAGNQSAWSAGTTSTILACHAASGHIRTVRELPVYKAHLSADPAGLAPGSSDTAGAYDLYFASSGSYDLSVERNGFGMLPARIGVAVAGHLTDLDFYLPPLDDRVANGGFEAGGWGAWQPAGSKPPSLTTTAHTGQGAVLLDPAGGDSRLSQSLGIPAGLTQPTLSLMVRHAAGSGPASKLRVQVVGATTITDDLAIPAGAWIHAWYDLSGMAGQTVELRLIASDDPAVIVDEVSLGSALAGVHQARLPLVTANQPAGP